MTFKENVKNLLLYNGYTKGEYYKAKPRVSDINFKNLKVVTIPMLLVGVLATTLSFFSIYYSATRIAYIPLLVAMVLTLILEFTICRNSISARNATTLLFCVSIFTYSIILACSLAEKYSFIFMVIAVGVPAIFTFKLLTIYIIEILSYFILLVTKIISLHTQWPGEYLISTMRIELINSFVCVVLGLLIAYFQSRNSFENALLTITNHDLAFVDLLTGLNNRNAYERTLTQLKNHEAETITCIYCDANNLHELNNTEGHEAGDDMICFVAQLLERYFTHEYTFRTGGDEFVSFVFDSSDEVVAALVSLIRAKTNENGYSVAIGYKTISIEDLDNAQALVNDAEKYMYNDKSRHYTELGLTSIHHDRNIKYMNEE